MITNQDVMNANQKLTQMEVHVAKFLEYSDRLTPRQQIIDEMAKEHGNEYSMDVMNFFFKTILRDEVKLQEIVEWLHIYRAHENRDPFTYFTDDELDDLFDGRDVEEIVKRTYYDKFPNLTPQQVRDLVVKYHLNS